MKGLVAILGSGESGKGAAILAKKVGYRVFVSDSNKIINNVKGINRVVYDITSKPPSTIELE